MPDNWRWPALNKLGALLDSTPAISDSFAQDVLTLAVGAAGEAYVGGVTEYERVTDDALAIIAEADAEAGDFLTRWSSAAQGGKWTWVPGRITHLQDILAGKFQASNPERPPGQADRERAYAQPTEAEKRIDAACKAIKEWEQTYHDDSTVQAMGDDIRTLLTVKPPQVPKDPDAADRAAYYKVPTPDDLFGATRPDDGPITAGRER